MRHSVSLQLESREVCLWTVRLEATEANFARCLGWLSPDETARAERFHFPRHRNAYVLGRAALRALLAGYLGATPQGVRFDYGPQGKPALAPDDGLCSLRFNASNAGDFAAYVFTKGCEIGVDIEQHRALPDLERIARRFFAPEETAELMELSPSEQTSAFFRCWTRKEAYIKAMGGGFSIPLNSFRVTLRPGAAARMVSLGGSGEAARGWTMHSFDPASGYTGAIAYPDESRSVREGPIISVDGLLTDLLTAESAV